MLRELRIRNLAVIETATVPFAAGFNVLTGETGAGKSILIDSILLIRGGRAQADVIRAEAESATLEAVFEVGDRSPAVSVLHAAGLEAEDGAIVVRRELARTGRHRAFVNDSPVTVALLERLGDHLVEVHGQHEHQRLLEPTPQLELLDHFAATEEARERVGELFEKFRAAQEEVGRLRAVERDRAQRIDLLRFQVAELDAARLRSGEEEALRTERTRLQHAERFLGALAELQALLADDPDAVVGRLARAVRRLEDLARLDPSFGAPRELLETAAAHVEEALLSARGLRESIEADPRRLEAIDERMDALTRLKRKYGDTESAMLAFREAAARDLEQLEHYEEFLATEERRVGELRTELGAAALALGRARREAAARLGPQIQRELRALGMDRARLQIGLEELPEEAISARGRDRVEFRLSANPGEELRPLARIASGGELARTMLALQAVLARGDRVPTMVFDEVDAGIGGRIASVVAEKLETLGRGRQVLCVTHLPQIAARAHHHLRVEKAVRGGRTRASVDALAGDERVQEVARMLGGEGPSATALRHARELLALPPKRGA